MLDPRITRDVVDLGHRLGQEAAREAHAMNDHDDDACDYADEIAEEARAEYLHRRGLMACEVCDQPCDANSSGLCHTCLEEREREEWEACA